MGGAPISGADPEGGGGTQVHGWGVQSFLVCLLSVLC